MKVSLFALAPLAVAPLVSAYPWMAEEAQRDIDAFQLSGRDLEARADNPVFGGFLNFLQNIPALPGQIANLTDLIKQAQDALGPVPGNPDARLKLPWDQITPASIYETFGIKREPDASDHKRGLVKVWGPADNPQHPYIPYNPRNPEHAGWQRGPCPGLNTVANHGYIPRNGIVNPLDLFIGLYEGLSLSPDLCALLCFAGFVWKGDLLTMTMSIGGNKDVSGKKIRSAPGINEHGFLEGDASMTRGDAAIGDQVRLNTTRYNRLKHYSGAGTGKFDITIKSLGQSRKEVYDDCVKNNPKCDINPLRMVVMYAESGFGHEVFRGSGQVLTEEILDSFFVHERFPPGWSRRFTPVTSVEMGAWGAAVWAANPVIPGISLGGIFLPVPTINSLLQLGSAFNGGKPNFNLLKGAICSVVGLVLGFVPGTITGPLTSLNVPGFASLASC
ncbi:hypothetical protein Q8F55_003284 [Vanrija albida]|uniref:Heme haloperoxidase family profile domain-containing protein n=1 Tax=Vanrija albida TaxID=181172 RepID=A0ABR3Q3H6_9TREE